MNTTLAATIDRNIIHGLYYHAGSADTVDITVRVYHRYLNSLGQENEIELTSFVIPKEALLVGGLVNLNQGVEQHGSFCIANLRYVENLVIQTEENRGGLVITRSNVLSGDDTVKEEPGSLPTTNPMEHDTHEENTPPEESAKPGDNVVITEPIVSTVFSSKQHSLNPQIMSGRIYFDDTVVPQTFKEQKLNNLADLMFIEDGVSNFLANADFNSITPLIPSNPVNYKVVAPGFIISSLYENGAVENTRIWKIRVANPNVFNAFNVDVQYEPKATIPNGLQVLTTSVYYKIAADFGGMPFSTFEITVNYYDQNQNFISSSVTLKPVAPEDRQWHLLYATDFSVPPTAYFFNFKIKMPDIGSTDPFVVQFYLPQAEASNYPTTRTLTARVLDLYRAPLMSLKPPIYIKLRTHHISGPGIRGLFDSTTALKNGIQFYMSSNKLYLKVLDVSGNVSSLTASALLPPIADNTETDYGVWFDGSTVEFYLNNVMVSVQTQAIALDQSVTPIIGSLSLANTTINSRLIDFGVFTTKP